MIHVRRQHEGRTYYYPAAASEVLNVADEVHVDTKQPGSRGYGGRLMEFEVEDGTTDEVKGPWHVSAPDEFNLGELHLTRVTLQLGERVIYQEKEPVLGHYHRGDRIAQQLADAWGVSIFVAVDGATGGHAHMCRPGDKLHPLAQRNTDPLL